VCVYCGISGPLTKDHVPPKCLFPRPRPTDLITVPACETCNGSFSTDDEYFRIAMVAPATEHTDGARVWQEVRRRIRKQPKLRQTLVQSITPIEVRTKAGLYLGTTKALSLSTPRIHAVLHRIIRGLLWHHYGVLLPVSTAAFETRHNPDVTPILPMLQADTVRSGVGGEVFRYRHGLTRESLMVSLWWTCFYATTTFLTIVDATVDGMVLRSD
jgi:hypothetical protein